MISVVMPAYNVEKYIAEAIESILKQTYENFEFIIVNDNSSDKTLEIIERYSARDNRIIVLQSAAGNAGGARNVGIKAATRDYIAFMDADDIAFPERLQLQYEAAKRDPDVVAWGTYLQRITDNGIEIAPIKVGCITREEFYALDRTKQLIQLYAGVTLVRRDILEKAGLFDPRFPIAEEGDLSARLAEFGPILVVPEILLYYRQHDNSISVRNIDLEHKYHGYIKARHAARLENRDLSLEDYLHNYSEQSPIARFGTLMRSISQMYGRKYKIAFAKKRYAKTLLFIFLMFMAHPIRFITRLWEQISE